MISPDLRKRTTTWIAEDPEERTREELTRVLADAVAGVPGAAEDLESRMGEPLTFGTAGLRAPVRAGVSGMNVAVVVRTTAGIAEWLHGQGLSGRTVVVGRDARHGSEAFAHATAEVFAASGFDTRLLPGPLPTPVLAYAVRTFGAVAGVQITASHNPPADNGYKLYDGSGAQIVPPADERIEAAIGAARPARSVPRATNHTEVGPDLLESYLDACAAVRRNIEPGPRIVLTPMHGVGGRVAVDALARAGFTDVHLVGAQAGPDPDFPTVAFPNPEEPGAADLLLELAAEREADLAIALDPDADRCAIGVRDAGGWRMLRGDETGALLGEYLLATNTSPDPLVATTIVSSGLLAGIAQRHGARYDETLTGFKWLVRSGDGAGTGLVYAYEEALGLCVDPDVVRDKDGISAAVFAADHLAQLRAADRTVPEALDELARSHGVHLTGQYSPRFTDLSEREAIMRRLRAEPPGELAGTAVACTDLLPRTDGLRITGEAVKVVIRPSGTEPKLKCYAEIALPPRADLDSAKAEAAERLEALLTALGELLAS
ncbi:phospho-sugar mutase [Sciscionella marina]|uniref:phospho-sugar mutase n=1 Tax=Sciscionella marina TaxID=508770 RepID=UPI00035E52DA|nr:phospho-sugar mutase [Sciscionella marina]